MFYLFRSSSKTEPNNGPPLDTFSQNEQKRFHLKVALKKDCLPHVLFCLLRGEKWELLLGRCRMALGSHLCLPRASLFRGIGREGRNRKPITGGAQGLAPRSRNPQRRPLPYAKYLTGWMRSVCTLGTRGTSALDRVTAQGGLTDDSTLNPKYMSWISGCTLSLPSNKANTSKPTAGQWRRAGLGRKAWAERPGLGYRTPAPGRAPRPPSAQRSLRGAGR